MKKPEVFIYTDGSCRGNPGPGGWGALLRFGSIEKELSGFDPQTTNNRMELMAALEALKSLKKACVVHLYTDSNYLKKGMTEWRHVWEEKGWKTAQKLPVKNQDLWRALIERLTHHTVHWHWVKAHNGHLENERVDALAKAAIEKG